MGDTPPTDEKETDWLKKNVATFRTRLKSYLNSGRDQDDF
jgi:hypothetical protein